MRVLVKVLAKRKCLYFYCKNNLSNQQQTMLNPKPYQCCTEVMRDESNFAGRVMTQITFWTSCSWTISAVSCIRERATTGNMSRRLNLRKVSNAMRAAVMFVRPEVVMR